MPWFLAIFEYFKKFFNFFEKVLDIYVYTCYNIFRLRKEGGGKNDTKDFKSTKEKQKVYFYKKSRQVANRNVQLQTWART